MQKRKPSSNKIYIFVFQKYDEIRNEQTLVRANVYGHRRRNKVEKGNGADIKRRKMFSQRRRRQKKKGKEEYVWKKENIWSTEEKEKEENIWKRRNGDGKRGKYIEKEKRMRRKEGKFLDRGNIWIGCGFAG